MDDLPTTELLARACARDERAFATLVARHRDVLLRVARGLLGPGGAYEDAVQETFWKLVRKPPRLDAAPDGAGHADEGPDGADAQLGRWLLQVTRNHCMDWLRQESRRRQREHAAAVPEATPGGIDGVETRDERARVERELAALPEAQREVLVLRLCADKSYREIAELTGRPPGTVGWLISQGLGELGRRLDTAAPRGAGPDASADADTDAARAARSGGTR